MLHTLGVWGFVLQEFEMQGRSQGESSLAWLGTVLLRMFSDDLRSLGVGVTV